MFQWLCKNIVLKSMYLKAGCEIPVGTAGFWYQEAVVLHGRGSTRTGSYICLLVKTKYFPLLNWNSQIKTVAETKKKKREVSIFFSFWLRGSACFRSVTRSGFGSGDLMPRIL